MKILFTGGGTGGHFYPIIAIVEELNQLIKDNKLIGTEIYYMSPNPYNPGILFENNIIYKKNSAGKLRRYFSILNFIDLFKTSWGIINSIWQIFLIYPDVIFGKGGYASFPALFAAKVLRIPVVIHESDSIPGRVNLWAGKFAKRIAISYPEALSFFPKNKVSITGNPVRKEIATPLVTGAHEFLKLEKDVPVIFVLGGSLGAQNINEAILEAVPKLVEKYQIIHQVGKRNIEGVRKTGEVILLNNKYKERYKPFDYLNSLAMRMAAGVADIVISRAGSTIFEIASWEKPSIIIPISEKISHDQKTNAYSYARSGAAVVIEESNLSANIIVSEIDRLMNNPEEREKMKLAGKSFFKPEAAKLIAEEILKIAIKHEIPK